MRKSKILMVMTALVLAVVGVLAAVTSVLSAQQQSVTSSLQVTYQANNVSAIVSVNSRKQSTSFDQNETASATFNPADSEHSSTNSNLVTLAAGSAEFGTFETESNVSTFQRYVVYRFSFQNQYADDQHGSKMSVTMNYTAPSGENNKNVAVLWIKSTAEASTQPNPSISGTTWASYTDGTGKSATVSPTSGSTTNVFVNGGNNNDGRVPQGTTYYLYLFVMIADVTKPAKFALNGTNNGILTFTLNGVA